VGHLPRISICVAKAELARQFATHVFLSRLATKLWNALIKKGPNTSKLEEHVGTTKRAAPGIAMQQQLRAPGSGDRILIARRLRRTLLGGFVTSSSFPLPLLFFFLFLGYVSLTLRERIVGFWHL
jgi:hypothetical protein